MTFVTHRIGSTERATQPRVRGGDFAGGRATRRRRLVALPVGRVGRRERLTDVRNRRGAQHGRRAGRPRVVDAMTAALAHRGPDGEGTFIDGPFGMGHRRLAIIDLTDAGRQPMESPDGDLVITYGGEVYNFPELRDELDALGHRFPSRTDTEVVLHAYQEWGIAAIERFNGMFAFAIWNKRTQRAPACAGPLRDQAALLRPSSATPSLFASEVKAFLQHPRFRARLSLPHLVEYFTFQNIFTDGTLLRGVHLLPAGTGCGSGRWITGARPVLGLRLHDRRRDPSEEAAEELRRLFDAAVQRQLVSDVPVGAYLSGGTDSAGITAIAARHIPYLSTFTGGFDLTSASGLELGFDERAKAEALSYHSAPSTTRSC